MAAAQLLTSIRISDLRPLGSADYPVYRLFQSLTETLHQHLDEDVALFLAQPVHDANEVMIDYFSDANGKVSSFDSLDKKQREDLLARVGLIGARMYKLATELKEFGDQGSLLLAVALEQAACIPDTDAIYQIGNVPVITAWGFATEPGGEYLNICKLAKKPEDPPPYSTTATVSEGHKGWGVARWLIILLILFVLGGLLYAFLFPGLSLFDRSEEELQKMDQQLEEAGGEAGEITITLFWNSTDDVDLELHCPNNGKVHHNRTKSCDGWVQDVDVINKPEGIENIKLEQRDKAQRGEYSIKVSLHELRNNHLVPIPFKVRVIQKGEITVFESDLVEKGQYRDIFRFTLE